MHSSVLCNARFPRTNHTTTKHTKGCGHLESAHVPRVPGVLQTVLVALEEELEEEPGRAEEKRTVIGLEKEDVLQPQNTTRPVPDPGYYFGALFEPAVTCCPSDCYSHTEDP